MSKKFNSRRLKLIVISLCVIALIVPTTALGNSNFEGAENIGLGAMPNAVATGDFNKDGLPDLVTANPYEDQVSILLNDRSGTYQEKYYPVGITPSDVAVGDLNGDKIEDIVTANSGNDIHSSTVSILVGQASGEFKTSVTHNVYIDSVDYNTFAPSSVTIGDYNKDSFVDLALSNGKSLTNEFHIVLLLGEAPQLDGTLTFSEPFPIRVGYKPSSLTTGDINKDGNLDFIVTHTTVGKVSVITNSEDLTTMSTSEYPIESSPTSSVIGDMNGDGHADIIVATAGDSAGISILQGDGQGAFTSAVKFNASCQSSEDPTFDDPYSIDLADLDGDGDLDLAVGCAEATQVSVLLNNSASSVLSFQAADQYAVHGSYSQIVITDFNADSKKDVVATNYEEEGNNINFSSILLGRGDGTLIAPVNYDVNGNQPLSVTSIDFDGDRKLDIATANFASNNVSIMRGNGKGQFASAIHYPVGSAPSQLLSADLNLDGKPDLVIANSGDNTITRLLNDGTGSFISKTFVSSTVSGSKARTITVADFNGDKNPDIAVAHLGSNQLSVLLGDGKGEFEGTDHSIDNRIATPNSIVSGHFNDDDNIDLAIANSGTNKVYILNGQGDGTFTTGNEYGANNAPSALATGDFNSDGWADIAVTINGPFQYSLHALFGSQTGTFREESISPLENPVFSLAVGDYNGDQKLDIAIPGVFRSLSVFIGDGTGDFDFENSYGTDVTPRSVAAGDFNNDGKDDLATANRFADTVTIIKSFIPIPVIAPPATPPANPIPDNPIILDGVKLDKIATFKEVIVEGRSTTIVSIDTDKLIVVLEGKNNQLLTIPVTSKSDVIQTELNGKMIKSLEKTGTVIKIVTNDASYTIPSKQVLIDQIATQFGNNVKLEDIKLSIRIGKSSPENTKLLDSAAANQNVTLVAPAINFELVATYGDRTIKIDQFDRFVSREIVLPNVIDPTKITTGVVLNKDGTLSHIPTNIFTKDGKLHAELNSLTNSTYSIIWNSKKFADVEGHWSQNDVNNMASRLIVDGVTATSFQPDQNITRAEFLAIVVRALGLKSAQQTKLPQDVSPLDWYASVVQTALTYKLVQGFEDNTIKPNQTITRQEAAVILSRALAITSLTSTVTDSDANDALRSFGDSEQVSGWAKNAVALMVINEIMQGNNQQLSAERHLTRAQTAAIVTRFLQQAKLINK